MTNSMFDKLKIREVEFSNRVWVSPMCQYSAIDGVVGEWHRIHLGAFASGGAGLVMVEATAVVANGRISTGCTGLWSDKHAQAFIPMIDFAHSMGTRMGIQLAHAGRKGSTLLPWDNHVIASPAEGGWDTDAPSALSYQDFPVPHALSVSEIHALTQEFISAAKRAVEVGFDVIELHAAHGYLFHQFLSPLSNERVDQYGGSFENRIRFLCEVATQVRKIVPESNPLFVRISATDWVDGGWALKDSIELTKILKEIGVDLIDVSSGGLVHYAKIITSPGYQVEFSEAIRKESGILTSAVGLIMEASQAEEILQSGRADAVMLGRAMLRNPHWPMSAAEDLGVRISWQKQFERARKIAPRPSPQ